MSHLSDLIARLCPSGVEWKRLGEVCDFITGFAFKASLFKNTGLPICKTTNISNGAISLSAVDHFNPSDYKDNLERYKIKKFDIVIGMSGSIKVGMNRTDQVLYLNQRVGKFLPDSGKLLNSYLYYFLTNSVNTLANNIGGGSVKNLSNGDILNILIPLPPLEIQREIVQVLDNFANLTAELTAELTKRKKQYEHYRDSLLNFNGNPSNSSASALSSSSSVEWKRLGEVCEVETGGEPPINAVKGKNPVGDNIYPIYANGLGDNALWGFSCTAVVNRSAVTFSSIGTIGHPTIRNSGFTPIIRLKVIYPKDERILNLSFLKYALEIIDFKQQKSSVPNINAKMIKALLIPLPPLAEQERIVAILDKFDALCNSLSVGLPAEIELRKKQYEFYRDKLLSFPRVEAAK